MVLDYLSNTKRYRRGECNSIGGLASAQGLAKMAAYMANRGSFEGK